MTQKVRTLAETTPGVWLVDVARITEFQQEGMKSVGLAMNGMLLSAILAAALGVVNMTVITIIERRRELGILRAAGASKGQLEGLISIEGFLIGVAGSIVGTLLGVGLVLLCVVISAGSPMGFPDFPVWTAAWNCALSALGPGLLALLTTPWLTALSARIPTRRMLCGSVITMLGHHESLV